MAMTPIAQVSVNLKREDGTIVPIHEGDIVHGLRYKSGTDILSIDGAVRVINATTKGNSTIPATCPPEPYVYKNITVTSLVIDSSDVFDAELTRIAVSSIVDIDSVSESPEGVIIVGPSPQYKSLNDVIADAADGTMIMLKAGEYNAPLNIDKKITLYSDAGAVLSGPITITSSATRSADVNIYAGLQLTGLTLSGKATIKVNTTPERPVYFGMTCCTFGGHDLTEKTMPIAVLNGHECVLFIENCVFKAQNEHAYNLIDVNGKLMTSSAIRWNTFEADCCTHNQISLYGLCDEADVSISNNVAEYSGNLVRIGFKGAPKGIMRLESNTYKSTDESSNGAYAGLLLIQPYSSQTETFAGLTVYINKTVRPEGCAQIAYLYASGKDTPWTTENQPVVYIDDQLVNLPNASVTI